MKGRVHQGAALAAIALVAAVGSAAPAAAKDGGKLRVESLSSDPELVTGGDALIAIDVPKGTPASKVRVALNGSDVTDAFEFHSTDRQLVGLVEGLRAKQNRISALAKGATRASDLTVYNSPITGPLFSGPQQQPFVCTTENAGLGAPTDTSCSATTKVEYRYRSTGGGFKVLPDIAQRPADLAQTTTRDGRTVDYVVRVESGTINRSIYRWAVLAPGGIPDDGWNRRLVHTFGGGCGGGYQQGNDRDRHRPRQPPALAGLRGFELKPHRARHRLQRRALGRDRRDGQGARHRGARPRAGVDDRRGRLGRLDPAADDRPELPGPPRRADARRELPRRDASPNYPDCRLLNAYFATADGQTLTDDQKVAITRHGRPQQLRRLGAGADVVNATEGCDESVVRPARLRPGSPTPAAPAARSGTAWSTSTGATRRPASRAARSTTSASSTGSPRCSRARSPSKQFLDLNEAIGGYDNNGDLVAQRSVADPDALEIAYRTGRINRRPAASPRCRSSTPATTSTTRSTSTSTSTPHHPRPARPHATAPRPTR